MGKSATARLVGPKTSLLDREEPKDFADIWEFCTKMGLALAENPHHAVELERRASNWY
jgi:hypothetical protein